jgi:glutamine amidotransferase
MQSIAIIDYNMGNLHSVERAMRHVAGTDAKIAVTSDPYVIYKADRIVFPGQGAARDCMRELETRGIGDVVREVIQTKPFLGICMGMQVLMQHSEENGGIECLGIYAGNVRYFGTVHQDIGVRLKIPQMGWNQVWQQVAHPLWQGIPDGARFYFVHSYYVEPNTPDLIAGSTDYGMHYTSAIAKDNVFAIQCHPEKSADDGLQLLKNFVNWQL